MAVGSANINPAYITSAAVPKEETRNQLQHIKDTLAWLETNAVITTGWRRLSTQALAAPASEVRCNLPDGYSRYRIEFHNVTGSAVGQLMARTSTDNTTYMTGALDYSGVVVDSTSVGNTNYEAGGAKMLLTGSFQNSTFGATGHMEFDAARLQHDLYVHYVHNTGPTRTMRRGAIASPIARWVQFFLSDYAYNFGIGSTFTVMARP